MVEFTLDQLLLFFASTTIFFVVIWPIVKVILEPIAVALYTLSLSMGLVWAVFGFSSFSLVIFFHVFVLLLSVRLANSFLCRFYQINSSRSFSTSITFVDVGFFHFFLWFTFVIVVLANLYHFKSVGPALLADDVAIAKTMGFSGGGGIVRRINWSLLPFCFICLFYLIVYFGWKQKYVLGVFLLLFFTLLGGGKGGIIGILTMYSVVYASKSTDLVKLKSLNFRLGLLGALGLVFALVVLFLSASSLFDAYQKLVVRLLYFGDVNLYIGSETVVNKFLEYDFFDYVSHSLNPLLGFFRLVEYSPPIGTLMVHEMNAGSDSVEGNLGPNLTFYATAYIFFGSISGFFYSSLLGCFVGVMRFIALYASEKRPFLFVFYSYLSMSLLTLIIDPLMWTGRLYDSVILITICFSVSFVAYHMLPKRKVRQMYKKEPFQPC